ncbi:MAG: CBS domain-containing protein [Candidatus Syntrophonatronum acetioxidans]|uniref:CBS domain-containing protein n=1 Tax=Candidatus Syntrophonatronum acetioxidans TaxID=1795816 RepID=A0A424YF50_9FIRM|nr:MAG: CBS domain-containing protein [Candidatus Syntrophonatronum acetioxidans]
MRARDVMVKNVMTVKEHDTLQEVAKILVDEKISGVPVIDDNNKVVGIITEGDLIYQGKSFHVPAVIEILGGVFYFEDPRKIEKDLRKMVGTKAKDVMTTSIITVEENTLVEEIATIMVEKGINRVPVTDDAGRLVGIVTRQDLIKTIHEQR